jgi:hypothetical protein
MDVVLHYGAQYFKLARLAHSPPPIGSPVQCLCRPCSHT